MEATSITVSEYFRTYHDHNVEFPRWPCLQVGTEERPIYLPVDVSWYYTFYSSSTVGDVQSNEPYVCIQRCKINEGQRFNGLDNEQFTALIAASSQLPAAKGQAILKVFLILTYTNINWVNFDELFWSFAHSSLALLKISRRSKIVIKIHMPRSLELK